ncbi:Retrotransposable element Tf2 155 kDa protein type 1 [Vespula squamosa]|uniref:Retrotransposable element Tf2 155 kDa protein type 1 n=1 Tax=Vespula squamosa TaxID=30214 RepID=A0ABD2AZC8_VESSQ
MDNCSRTIKGFTPKYLLEGEQTRILPKELKQEKTERPEEEQKTNAPYLTKAESDRISELGIWFLYNIIRLVNRERLDESKISPYKILQKLSDSIYKIDTVHKKAESKMFHITKLPPAPVTPIEEP